MSECVFTRTLKLDLPYARGADVLALQRRLAELNSAPSPADGVFGPQTDRAFRAWEARVGITPDGICNAAAWSKLFPAADATRDARWTRGLPLLLQDHSRFPGPCRWRLSADGIGIDGAAPSGSEGAPVTMQRIWDHFGTSVTSWSTRLGVPAELILATIATESGGDPNAIRFEPRYRSDETTPDQVSPGLMQTLISTARETLGNPGVDRSWLLCPDNAIQAGTACILQASGATGFDPPVVACCYNAGSVIENDSAANRWRMRQYPIGTGQHADRFVMWFNDAMRVLAPLPSPPPVSFTVRLRPGASS
ncbi:MAG: transglycosylase SLT domain-containing protein [Acetobacteraceae bacterium]|nr:transglycosylase SLT domain-containing protein [Acetobacteraceae bacterium]